MKIQIDFPLDSEQRMKELIAITESDAQSVISNALRLYSYIIDQHNLGATFIKRDADGFIEDCNLFK